MGPKLPESLSARAPDGTLLKQSAAGAAAEFTKVLTVYPLDLVRGRLSGAAGLYAGMWGCLRGTIRTEGVLALYKGMSACLLVNTGRGSMQFAIYGAAQRRFQELLGAPADTAVPAAVSLAAGATAGAVSSLAECPLEVVMTQLQVQDAHCAAMRLAARRDSMDCALQQFNSGLRAKYAVERRYGHGGFPGALQAVVRNRACFMGVQPLVFRNSGFYAAVWFAFEELKASAARFSLGEDSRAAQSQLPFAWKLTCGGAAGCFAWTVVFPLEALKLNMQGQPLERRFRHFHSNIQCAKHLYAEGGVRRFYIGLGPTLVRAFPANAVAMGMNDIMRTMLGAY